MSPLRYLQDQLVASQQPPHAAALERQGQFLKGLCGGLFAVTGELVDEKGQGDAPGAPAGAGEENGCGHGNLTCLGGWALKTKKAEQRSPVT